MENLRQKITKMLKQGILRKKIVWIPLVVFIILGFSGTYVYITKTAAAKAATADEPTLQTAVARRGELVVMASGTGQLEAAEERNLAFDEDGTLIELNVAVGDKVKAGDLLARLQTKNTPETIQANIASAELSVIKAQNTLDDLYASAETTRATALNDVATYAQAVRDAQYQLENYTTPTTFRGLSPIEAFDLMKQQLDAASKAFEPYRGISQYDKTRQDLLEKLNEAQSNYDSAVKYLDYEYQLEVAESNLKKARQDYDAYKDGPAQSKLKAAQNELANAKANLALVEEDQSVLELTAPINGTVTSLNAKVGEFVSTSYIMTLADLDQYYVNVSLDQTDLDKVAVGYPAEVIFDALPDKTYTGEVASVNPSLETVSNVATINALVKLDQASLPPGINLPIGLTAAVDIIAGKAENAVLVPVEALRQIDAGEYAVFVQENGELKLIMVTVGLMDLTSAEIVSGLEAGDIVSTGVVQTQ